MARRRRFGAGTDPGNLHDCAESGESARARRQQRLERALPGRHGRTRVFVLASPRSKHGGVSMSARAKSLAFARAAPRLVRLNLAPLRRLSSAILLVALAAPGAALAQSSPCGPTTQP